MTEIIGVRFKKAGKVYFFDPEDKRISTGTPVIVETVRGIEYGITAFGNRVIPNADVVQPLKKIIRLATMDDAKINEQNRAKEKEAYAVCFEKIQKHNLDMKLIDVELTFDHNKLIFYFTSDGRVDFRELVKELASIFRTRIELRQIGVRDEAKMLNGVGICGRALCCSSFLGEFHQVSIKMAKEQNLSLNPAKISGVCGRLMCCLKHEEETYIHLNKNVPSVGDIIRTSGGNGEVLAVNILRQTVKAAVRQKETDTPQINYYPVSEITIVERKHIQEPEPILEQYDE